MVLERTDPVKCPGGPLALTMIGSTNGRPAPAICISCFGDDGESQHWLELGQILNAGEHIYRVAEITTGKIPRVVLEPDGPGPSRTSGSRSASSGPQSASG